MGQRITGFLVVFLLMFSGEAFTQENLPGKGSLFIPQLSYYQLNNKMFVPKFSQQKLTRATDGTAITRFTLLNISQISYYPAHLGFFCKKELQLDKITPLPFRFRLGSLEYVNWMERKPNAVKPGVY